MIPSTPTRPFTIKDMAILVVLVACSIVSVRNVDPELGKWQGLPPLDFFIKSVVLCYESLNRMLIPWPPGLLMMRLVRPRPFGMRLWRQPGFVASTAATAAAAVELVHTFAMWIFSSSQRDCFWEKFWFVRHDDIHRAVLGAWTILILSQRWRSEASWVDRAGRGIGFLWVGLYLSGPVEWLLH